MVRIALAFAIVILVGMVVKARQAEQAAVYTVEQAARGKLAMKTNALAIREAFGACSDCHAEGLRGRVGDASERPSVESL